MVISKSEHPQNPLESEQPAPSTNFIKNIINDDIEHHRIDKVVTRFPPEPNGYLHIGHAAAACLSFSIFEEYRKQLPQSRFHLRFDDTNPEREDTRFVEAIKEDLKWLGIDWNNHLYFASDYFEQLYNIAVHLIENELAYICHLTQEQVIEYRGTLKQPGRPSPYRDRTVTENLELFGQMAQGCFEPGSCVLRAKIDMSSGNVHMRDPVIYRIRKIHHHRVGDRWNIYPAYDFTHCLSDALEGITHSLCSLEFQDHRPLYDWFVAKSGISHTPHQYEFSRLNIDHTVTSKRKLKQLVDEKYVKGWDDPRMPTLAGMRARGYPPAAIRAFCKNWGVSRSESIIELSVLEDFVRRELNQTAPRAMAVINPLKVIVTNFDESQSENYTIANHPKDDSLGERQISFSREIYIDRDDFELEPPKGFFRLAPNQEVRLRGGYVIKCENVIKYQDGSLKELHVTYDPATLGKKPEGRKVKGVIHWVDAKTAKPVAINEYDRLFMTANPNKDEKEGVPFTDHINPNSLICHKNCLVEASLGNAEEGATFQFERVGYFMARKDHDGQLGFDKVVSLKDSWTKEQEKN